MKPGLLTTNYHYGLLAIAIISSCSLFFLVASENAKNTATTKNVHVKAPMTPFEKVIEKAVSDPNHIEHVKSAKIVDISNNKKCEQITPNHRKIKKTSAKQKNAVSYSLFSSPANIFFSEAKSDVSIRANSYVGNKAVWNKLALLNHKDHDEDKYKNQENVDSRAINSDKTSKENEESVVIQSNAGELQIDDATCLKVKESLPNIITDIPAVTVTELPLEVLQPMQNSLNTILVETSNKKSNSDDTENRTVDILETKDDQPQQGEEIIKINDSGGGSDDEESPSKMSETFSSGHTTPIQESNGSITKPAQTTTIEEQKESESVTAESGGSVNLTNEEIPMPVFSEWAQKQMEAAEKQQQAKKQEVVNIIAQKKNLTNGSKKLPPLKMRAKNYASPDCGAKIIASNADATNTGAVLSSSKDEYMLSPCGNRIWFVVELCEAVQAQKVDLANFELFSSSPKNFTVAVSNRFPTREWSNVGRFIAEDKRSVQSFDLHPHLFGKFVRVDIHSHHSQEHFCPVSLFRVFGTSEIEAFETENHPDDDLDDFEDELYGLDQANAKNSDNIFKSASDAVLSIVKKAAEVLVKPANDHNRTLNMHSNHIKHSQLCRSYVYGEFLCDNCSPILVERVNNILSCEFRQLDDLLTSKPLRNDLLNTQICRKYFGLDASALNNDCSLFQIRPPEMDFKRSYYINLLPEEYIGALCYTLSGSLIAGSEHITTLAPAEKDNEVALNLTIDKKLKSDDFKTLNKNGELVDKTTKPESISKKHFAEIEEKDVQITTETPPLKVTADSYIAETEQLVRPPELESQEESPTPLAQADDVKSSEPSVAPDVNIFNIPVKTVEEGFEVESVEMPNKIENKLNNNIEEEVTEMPPSMALDTLSKADEDSASNIVWDNLDSLLTTTMSPGNNIGTNQAQNNGAGINLQQKISAAPQSESIFIRLSNRIKALERNMSLSGQYLEELSRRYKKQVEELQQMLAQQSQTVRSLEEQIRRHTELQELYEHNNAIFKNELDNMALQIHACIIVIIVVGGFVLLFLFVSIIIIRAIWRQNKTKTAALLYATSEKKRENSVRINQKKISRRKSFDEYSDHITEKMRRPSEEVTDILKKHLDIPDKHKIGIDKTVQTPPQRKISICYESSQNPILLSHEILSKSKNLTKRKNAKSSWPNSNDTHQMAFEQLENMRGMDLTLEEYRKILKSEIYQVEKSKTSIPIVNGPGKSRKKLQHIRRQESAPAQYINNSVQKSNNTSSQNVYSGNLILDEEDLDNFIPNSDLAYNEFMPDGPSGYRIMVDNTESTEDGPFTDKKKEKVGKKKIRRISSPSFFKTSFTKALKGKGLGKGINNDPVDSNTPRSRATSWEWHRLKNANINRNFQSCNSPSSVELLHDSPTGSLNASTLSEIHFPTNSTENSFRILEEAILSSGEAADDHSPNSVTKNSKNSHSATSSISEGSNSSQRSSISNSTSSSATKKKQRGFQRIFRKVF